MSIENSKIKNRILILGKKIQMDVDKVLAEAAKKYEMDLTKTVLAHASSLVKQEIEKRINQEATLFDFIRVLVDYGACEEELNNIIKVIQSVRDELASDLSQGADISNFNFYVNESMKLITLEFPSSWGTTFVDDYRKNLLETLRERDIVKI
ncbi:MAG: hypothetical protein ACTSR3_18160 [Candidatus Helarchaeota archaeon]